MAATEQRGTTTSKGGPIALNTAAKRRLKKIAPYSKRDNSAEARAGRMTGILGSMKRPLVGSGNSPEEKLDYARKNPNAEKYREPARRKQIQITEAERAAGSKRAGVASTPRVRQDADGVDRPRKRGANFGLNNFLVRNIPGVEAAHRNRTRAEKAGSTVDREKAFAKVHNLKYGSKEFEKALERMRAEAGRQRVKSRQATSK